MANMTGQCSAVIFSSGKEDNIKVGLKQLGGQNDPHSEAESTHNTKWTKTN